MKRRTIGHIDETFVERRAEMVPSRSQGSAVARMYYSRCAISVKTELSEYCITCEIVVRGILHPEQLPQVGWNWFRAVCVSRAWCTRPISRSRHVHLRLFIADRDRRFSMNLAKVRLSGSQLESILYPVPVKGMRKGSPRSFGRRESEREGTILVDVLAARSDACSATRGSHYFTAAKVAMIDRV